MNKAGKTSALRSLCMVQPSWYFLFTHISKCSQSRQKILLVSCSLEIYLLKHRRLEVLYHSKQNNVYLTILYKMCHMHHVGGRGTLKINCEYWNGMCKGKDNIKEAYFSSKESGCGMREKLEENWCNEMQ